MASFWTKRRQLHAEVDSYMDAILNPVDDDCGIIDIQPVGDDCSTVDIQCNTSCDLSSLMSVNFQCDQETDCGEVRPPCMSTKITTDETMSVAEPVGELESDISLNYSDNDFDEIASLEDEISCWATEHRTSQTAVGGLLKILHKWFPHFPLDSRTLQHTVTDVVTKETAKGSYYHYGLERGIQDELCRLSAGNGSDSVAVQFNIDGLPLYKSSSAQFWPILGAVVNCCEFSAAKDCSDPFLVGLYFGYSKPSDVNEFLSDFVSELSLLQKCGVNYCGKQYRLQVHSFCCDMPARAFIKCVTGHSGYGGCDKCEQHGKYVKCVTFPDSHARLRTDESFAAMTDVRHHSKDYVSPLMSLPKPVGMVSQFPIDYMHLVCLGVTRKLVSLWLHGPLKTRLGRQSVERINERLISLKQHVPCEFQRKPRSLSEYERWKATEYRQMLLYTGPLALSGILPTALYDNFMLLSVAIRMFLSPDICHDMCDYGHGLLLLFVEHFGQLYGADKISYNVHGLVHLGDEVKRFGQLDSVSSFPYENYLGKIKRLLKKPNSPLQQIVRRLSEQSTKCAKVEVSCVKQEHSEGPLHDCITSQCEYQYKELVHGRLHIKLTSPGDRFVLLKDTSIVSVENIVRTTSGSIGLLCRQFRVVQDFFSYPLPSREIGIFRLGDLGKKLTFHSLSEVVQKVVVLPQKHEYVCIPLIHTRQ